MGIVEMSLLLVVEDFIGLAHGFEFGICLLSSFFGDLVGMML
jgi:hypothetical protein